MLQVFATEAFEGEIVPDPDEVRDWRWVRPEQIDGLETTPRSRTMCSRRCSGCSTGADAIAEDMIVGLASGMRFRPSPSLLLLVAVAAMPRPALAVDPPYEAEMERLAEILGSLYFLAAALSARRRGLARSRWPN